MGKHYDITIQTEKRTENYVSEHIGETLLALLTKYQASGETVLDIRIDRGSLEQYFMKIAKGSNYESIFVWRFFTMETGYTQQNAAYHLLYCSSFCSFLIMGGIFTSIMPEARYTLIQSMTVFGVTMGALIGLPPSLVEIYSSNIKNVYKANGVPLSLGLIATNISAYIHLFLMSVIFIFCRASCFHAEAVDHPGRYFSCLAVFIAVSLGIANIIGLAVKDQAKTSMVSIIVFLPSIMLSGIMFPVELLPETFETMRQAVACYMGLSADRSSCIPDMKTYWH